jgi:peptide chain release factor subunit 1
MKENHLLNRLLDLEALQFPFISLYLDARPDQNGKAGFSPFVREQISENTEKFPLRSAERESFEKDAERIGKYLEDLDPRINGVAIFACQGAGFFEAADFVVPFERNHFFVFGKPHIYPLVRLLEQNPMFAVALADTNAARIFVVRGGSTLEKEDIQNVKTNRTEVGGWSQTRYQRHIENFHEQHAKEVAAELEKIVREMRIQHVLLAGDETIIIPLLRRQLSKEMEARIAGVLKLNVHTPENELLEAARSAIRQNDTLIDKQKIDLLFEQNYDGGSAVAGVEKTLEALFNGQVQELYISADFDTIDYKPEKIMDTLKNYAPGIGEELPAASQHGMLIDELLAQAARSAEEIRFIEDAGLLKKAGGVGALLRYQAKGVSGK